MTTLQLLSKDIADFSENLESTDLDSFNCDESELLAYRLANLATKVRRAIRHLDDKEYSL